MEWISVKDRLPECSETVIAWRYRTKQMIFVMFAKTCWSTNNGIIALGAISHWMPLPKPPKEESK